MTIPEHRLSTQVVQDLWIDPDGLQRALNEDHEKGPIAVNDNTEGMAFQNWKLTLVGNDLVITPEDVGLPQTILTVADVTQCSFAFDQNAHVSIAYTAAGLPYLYWYDSQAAAWVTDQLEAGATSPTLTMDDKRITQSQTNDILLWYTIEQPDTTHIMYTREQRDRYTIRYEMGPSGKFIYKLGMHRGLRVQVMSSNAVK